MPRPPADPEQSKEKRRLRNKRHRANSVIAARNRENNRLYQQRKREQTRLARYPNCLTTQSTDIQIEQEYQEGDGNVFRHVVTESTEDNVNGMVPDGGGLLETFQDVEWIGGSDGGFSDGFGIAINDDGN